MDRRRLNAPVVAATLATLVLSGCGGVTFGHASATTTAPAAAAPPSTSSSPEPSDTTTEAPQPTTTTTTAPSPTASAPTPKPSPSTTTVTPKPTPTAKKEGDTLQPGDSGAYVARVQHRLTDLGYWNGGADGTYGFLTSQAVMALQKAAGLSRDGVFGPATQRALQAGVRPVSRVGGTGIEVDKARQLLLVVRGGSVTMVLNTSTGSGQPYSYEGHTYVANTPVGTYSVFRTVDHLDKGPLGALWRPRYFNGGIAVHGAAAIPGYPASHGCARVSNPAMDMIWANDLMPVGSRVTVY